MKDHTVTDSPNGLLTLVADDGDLCGLYAERLLECDGCPGLRTGQRRTTSSSPGPADRPNELPLISTSSPHGPGHGKSADVPCTASPHKTEASHSPRLEWNYVSAGQIPFPYGLLT